MVDDLDVNRFLLEEGLSQIGAEILSADNGKRALEMVSASHPEVMVLDFQMPDVTGAEISRRIKSDPALPFTFIILMSGYREVEESEAVKDSRADRFLGKPYALDDLRSLVAEGIAAARARRATS